MTILAILCWCAIFVVAGNFGVWFVVGWRLRRAIRSGLSVRTHLDAPVEEHLVSIVIPAHNEARIIESCARALISQRWKALEIIFVADRCTDETVDILRRVTAADDRVRIIENHHCPPEWAGKCNAARLGAEGARGRWLVFMDADTTADPDLIRAAVTSAEARGSALLSLLTQLTLRTVYERRTQTVACMMLMTLYPPDRVNRDRSPRPFANGQFMLFDRDWYESIHGHESVRDDLLEDIAFSRRIAQAGGRVTLLNSDGMLQCSMYSSADAFRRGWQRIFMEACNRSPRNLRKWALRMRLLGLIQPLSAILGAGLGAVTWANGELALGLTTFALSAVALVFQAIVVSAIYRSFYQSWQSIWRFPMGCEDLARILTTSSRMLARGEPVVWGGREYVLEPR